MNTVNSDQEEKLFYGRLKHVKLGSDNFVNTGGMQTCDTKSLLYVPAEFCCGFA